MIDFSDPMYSNGWEDDEDEEQEEEASLAPPPPPEEEVVEEEVVEEEDTTLVVKNEEEEGPIDFSDPTYWEDDPNETINPNKENLMDDDERNLLRMRDSLDDPEGKVAKDESALESGMAGAPQEVPALRRRSAVPEDSFKLNKNNTKNLGVGSAMHAKQILKIIEDGGTYSDYVDVSHIRDGDTIETVDGRVIRVDGLDTAETGKNENADEKWALLGTEYLTKMLEKDGIKLNLISGKDAFGKYGRHLKYLDVIDGTEHVDVGGELLRRGLAVIYPDAYNENFGRHKFYQGAQAEAQFNKRGMWNEREGLHKLDMVQIDVGTADHPAMADKKVLTKYFNRLHDTSKGEKRQATSLESYLYNYHSTKSDAEYASDIASAQFDLGRWGEDPLTGRYEYNHPEELWGSDWLDLDFSQRLDRINKTDKAYLDHKYRAVIDTMDENEVSSFIGQIAGAVTTPTTWLGGGALAKAKIQGMATVKAMSIISAKAGALWGAEYEGLRQVAEDQQLDVKQMAVATATGAIFGVGTGAIVGGSAKAYRANNQRISNNVKKKLATADPDKMTTKEARKLMKEVKNIVVTKHVERMEKEIADSKLGVPNAMEGRDALARDIANMHSIREDMAELAPLIAKDGGKKFSALAGEEVPLLPADAASFVGRFDTDGKSIIRHNAFNNFVEELIGNPETVINNHAPELAFSLRSHDQYISVGEANMGKRILDIEVSAKEAGFKNTDQLWDMIGDARWVDIQNNTKLAQPLKDAINELDKYYQRIGDDAVRLGAIAGKKQRRLERVAKLDDNNQPMVDGNGSPIFEEQWVGSNFSARRVRDHEELVKLLPNEMQKKVAPAFQKFKDKTLEIEGRGATKVEMDEFFNDILSMMYAKGNQNMGLRSTNRSRQFGDVVPEYLKDAYEHPRDAALRYARDMDADIAMREFFQVDIYPELMKKSTRAVKLKAAIDQKLRNVKSGSVRRAGDENRSMYELTLPFKGANARGQRKIVIDKLGKDIDNYHPYTKNELKQIVRGDKIERRLKSGKQIEKERLEALEGHYSATLNQDAPMGRQGPQALSSESYAILKENLWRRFDPKRTAVLEATQMAKQIGHMVLLAHPHSSLIQVADIGMTALRGDLVSTFQGLKRTAGERIGVTDAVFNARVDAGITKAMYEMSHGGGLGKATDKTMRAVGFTGIDNFNKDVLLNSRIAMGGNLSRTAKGRAKIQSKYAYKGDKYVMDLIKDFNAYDAAKTPAERSKFFTTRMREYVLNEAYDTQPINVSQMPLWVQKNPNLGGLTHTLMSYTMKAMDNARHEIVYKALNGDVMGATRGVVALTAFVGGTNAGMRMVIDYISGRDVFADEAMERVIEEMSSLFLMGKFNRHELYKDWDANDIFGSIIQIPAFTLLGQVFAAVVVAGKHTWDQANPEEAEVIEKKEMTAQQMMDEAFKKQMDPDEPEPEGWYDTMEDKEKQRLQKVGKMIPGFGKILFGYNHLDLEVHGTKIGMGEDKKYNKKIERERKAVKAEEYKDFLKEVRRLQQGN